MVPWSEPATAPSAGRWRLSDLVTLGGIALAASLLLFPALASWRDDQQSTVCRDKMHRLGMALVDYSRLHGGLMPEVAVDGPLGHAGIYAPRLVEAGLVEDPSLFLCPGCSNDADTYAVPRLADLRRATPDQEAELARTMGGRSRVRARLLGRRRVSRPLRNLNCATFAVLADKPGSVCVGSLNHGCGGQTLLFEDGHAEFLSNCRLDCAGDELFRNSAGFVGAGIGRDDVVIVPSEARPLRQPPVAGPVERYGEFFRRLSDAVRKPRRIKKLPERRVPGGRRTPFLPGAIGRPATRATVCEAFRPASLPNDSFPWSANRTTCVARFVCRPYRADIRFVPHDSRERATCVVRRLNREAGE